MFCYNDYTTTILLLISRILARSLLLLLVETRFEWRVSFVDCRNSCLSGLNFVESYELLPTFLLDDLNKYDERRLGRWYCLNNP